MFLNLLNDQEKLAFLALARKVIISDNLVADKEKILYNSMQKEVEILEDIEENISDEDLDKLPDDIPQLCSVFTSKKTKISALMELIGLAFVDGKFVEEERKVIENIASHFDIKESEAQGYIDWASKLYI